MMDGILFNVHPHTTQQLRALWEIAMFVATSVEIIALNVSNVEAPDDKEVATDQLHTEVATLGSAWQELVREW